MDKPLIGRFWVAVLIASTLLFSCGPSGGSITVTSFTATPNPAFQQESATLSWQISGATSASISPGVGEVSASSGSVQVNPTENTTYTLTATGSGTSSKTLTLTVQPFGRPQLSDAGGNPLSGLIVGQAKDVIISVYVKTAGATVKARRGATELTDLLDNGSLLNGDEIQGDGVYSGKARLNEGSPGNVSVDLAITALGQSFSAVLSVAVVKPLEDAATQKVAQAHQSIAGVVGTLPASTSLGDAVSQAATHLKANAAALGIASVQSSGDLLEISYTSGLQSSIRFEDEASVAARGPTKGGSGRSGPSVPLEQQTRGEPAELPGPLADPPPENVGGRSVLVFSPFTKDFGTGTGDQVFYSLEATKLGFQVTHLQDAKANIAALANITQYDYVVLDTHGDEDSIMTNEDVSVAGNQRYAVEIANKEIEIHEILHRDGLGKPTLKGSHYTVNATWFAKHLTGRFKNSIIVVAACESLKSDKLWNVFSARGAGAYYGFTATVGEDFSYKQVIQLTGRLGARQTTGESFTPAEENRTNPDGSKAKWEMRGNKNLKFPRGLVNGNFEERLAGWSKNGDGRALSRISPSAETFPKEGSVMGVISTGLGFTTTSGSLEQSFYVDKADSRLKFSWNFLSEEFLEYIGSSFQDAFKVTIVRGDTKASQDHLNLSINAVATKFGASKCFSPSEPCASEGGSLKKGSPQIVFDKNDVWYTGWQSQEIDLTPYREKEITLRFLATDVGDSSFDTVVLIDEVKVE